MLPAPPYRRQQQFPGQLLLLHLWNQRKQRTGPAFPGNTPQSGMHMYTSAVLHMQTHTFMTAIANVNSQKYYTNAHVTSVSWRNLVTIQIIFGLKGNIKKLMCSSSSAGFKVFFWCGNARRNDVWLCGYELQRFHAKNPSNQVRKDHYIFPSLWLICGIESEHVMDNAY